MSELSGGNNDYYLVKIDEPKRLAPYEAECEDIIEVLQMTFAEGCAFKAIWRSCAARALGKLKPGAKEDGIYDAQKVAYYGNRMTAQRTKAARTNVVNETDVAERLEKAGIPPEDLIDAK